MPSSADRNRTDMPDLAVVDRHALKRIGAAHLVAMLALVVAATTIGLVIAYARIGRLEDDLRHRRAMRDQQQQQATEIVCTVLRHVNQPDAPDLHNIRVLYHCPPD